MIDFISNLYIISSLVIVALIYFATFMGILGKGDSERYPYLGVLSIITAYLIFILIKGYVGEKVSTVIWIALSVLPSLAVLTSLFVGRKGNVIVDIVSLAFVTGLGVIPLFNIKVYDINADLAKLLSDPSDLSLVAAYASLIVMIAFSMVTFSVWRSRYFSYSNIDEELSNKISEINRKQSTYDAFSGPILKMLSEEMRTEMNQMRNELKSEIVRTVVRSQNGSKISRKGGNDIMVEIRKLNTMVKNMQAPQKGFTIDEFMRDVKHSLATPLSQIETNCSLLETLQDPVEHLECIQKIKAIVKVCQSIITSYIDIVSAPPIDESLSLPEMIDELLATVDNKSRRKKLVFEKNGLPDTIPGYSVSVISSMLLPLIQNAIHAAPVESKIELSYQEKDSHVLTVKNACEKNVPTKEQLNMIHYSSKHNHLGVGLSTVRNYLRLMKGGMLDFDIDENVVIAKVILKKR